MKRLAILGTRGIPARYGGFETFAEEISVRLAEAGLDVTVFCQTDDDTSIHDKYKGVNLVYITAPSCGPLTTLLFDVRCLWRARKGFDVVYMLGYGAAPFCLIPRLWKTRVWLNVDGIEWARAKWNLAARNYFKLMEMISLWTPSRIIADAEAVRAHLWSRHSHRPKCSVIPYGATSVEYPPDASFLKEWQLKPGGYYLVVCRMEPENHVLEIIKGYKASRSSLPLILVGSPLPATDYIRKLLGHANDYVRFIGAIYDKERLVSLRYHCMAYIHGHSVGGTNPSLLEALACGNLLIAHDNRFNQEVAGRIGFFFKNLDDFVSILHKIERLSVSEKRALRNMARDRIAEKYRWSMITDLYLDLLMTES